MDISLARRDETRQPLDDLYILCTSPLLCLLVRPTHKHNLSFSNLPETLVPILPIERTGEISEMSNLPFHWHQVPLTLGFAITDYKYFVVNARGLIEGRIIYFGPPYSDAVSSFEANKTWKNSFGKCYDKQDDLSRLREQGEAYMAALLDMDEIDLATICSIRDTLSIPSLAIDRDWISGSETLTEDEIRFFSLWANRQPFRSKDVPKPDPASKPIAEPRRFLGSNLCMGLVPPQAQVGDLICRFYGCNVAAVLRPTSQNTFHIICRADVATKLGKNRHAAYPHKSNPRLRRWHCLEYSANG